MFKRSFFGLKKQKIKYESPNRIPNEPVSIDIPEEAVLFFNTSSDDMEKINLKIGDHVKKGERIVLTNGSKAIISTVSGTVGNISSYRGNLGRFYKTFTIKVDLEDKPDEQFQKSHSQPSLELAKNYLSSMPGNPSFNCLANPDKSIDTIIILGTEKDLLILTNQHILQTRAHNLEKGIGLLKNISGIENIIVVVHRDFIQGCGELGAKVVAVGEDYPASLPPLISRSILGKTVPAGKSLEDMGVSLFTAEAIASLGEAFETGSVPVNKTLTFIDKTGEKSLVTARIGTPIKKILEKFNTTVNDKDRIIIGGPMTGKAIFSDEYPVRSDTDAITIQDHSEISFSSDYPCINCGECIRICPTKVQVNMLVRFLEAGYYAEAADEYNLYSCIECGLCSFVCVSKIPIFQHIMLGKYELSRIISEEADHE